MICNILNFRIRGIVSVISIKVHKLISALSIRGMLLESILPNREIASSYLEVLYFISKIYQFSI
jgi:hypothetical protein